MDDFAAHINADSGEVQSVRDHCLNTAKLSESYAIDALKDLAFAVGLLHDAGKYSDSFQKRIKGISRLKVEHSVAGAKIFDRVCKSGSGKLTKVPVVAKIAELCIAGHHSGIPDLGVKNDTSEKITLFGRMKRELPPETAERFDQDLLSTLPEVDGKKICDSFDISDGLPLLLDKIAFVTRYVFSCLTDADSIDTALFCSGRRSGKLHADFKECLKRVNDRLHGFVCKTELQKARARIQKQVFDKTSEDAEIYFMSMPTGSGKTLCSMKFALERLLKSGKERIIYVIPYNSIIEQAAAEFCSLFSGCADILRHQSTFSFENYEDEDYRESLKYSVENWDAPIIITTAVQFFESFYGCKRGKLRKVHNLANAEIIFDEAHLLPTKFLQPCLEAIAFVSRYLNSEAVLLTATMPCYEKWLRALVFQDCKTVDLVTDSKDFGYFDKCTFHRPEEIDEEELVERASKYQSCLIVVNSRKATQRLYELLPDNKFCLSTYLTVYDRKKKIDEIRAMLAAGEKVYVVSTSLIEAGVDLDFQTVFREMTGLDSILQSGGRCNREGKRSNGDVFIFEFPEIVSSGRQSFKVNLTKGLCEKYESISSQDCIREYYDRLLNEDREEIESNTLASLYGPSVSALRLRSYAEQFKMIDTGSESVFVCLDPADESEQDMADECQRLYSEMESQGKISPREIQKYTFTLYRRELDDLSSQGVVKNYSGIWCLTNNSYYKRDTGITFEASDYYV